MIIYAITNPANKIVKVGQTREYPYRCLNQLGGDWVAYHILEEIPFATKQQLNEAELKWQQTHGVVDSYNHPDRMKAFKAQANNGAYKNKSPGHINHCFHQYGPIVGYKEDGTRIELRNNGDLIAHGANPSYVTRMIKGTISSHMDWVKFIPLSEEYQK